MKKFSLKKFSMKKIRMNKTARALWLVSRPFIVLCCSLLIVFFIISMGISFMKHKLLDPVDPHDATPIEFVINDGWGASTIAKHLYEACGEGKPGLIRNKAVFKVYVDFMGKSKELQAGRYYLSRNMDIPTIIETLCDGGESTKTVKVTIPEGTTIENIVNILKDNGMELDRDEFLELCKKGESFTGFEFINNVVKAKEKDRIYALEGYLFPDTYDFYRDASSATVITKMLKRYNDVCYSGEDSLYNKAKAIGMSMDEITALASMIEKEAVTDSDFLRVSAVFHNRLDKHMKLQSDAPLAYIYKRAGENLQFTAEELKIDSKYNTYVYEGVPIGAICNPGKRALEAAVSPDAEYVKEGYLFFCLKDPETGENAYAKTEAEHAENVRKYSPNW